MLITQENFGTQLFCLTWENILSSAILNSFHWILNSILLHVSKQFISDKFCSCVIDKFFLQIL